MSVSTSEQSRQHLPQPRRVRHEVRDGMTVVAFSATASCAVAVALLLLTRLAG